MKKVKEVAKLDRFFIEFNPALGRALKAQAAERGITKRAYVTEILTKAVEPSRLAKK